MTEATLDQNLQRLMGLGRAEANSASRLQTWIIRIQGALAVLAGATVYVTNDKLAYLGAILTLVLAALWAWVSLRFRARRGPSERARRATLLMTSLGTSLSAHDWRDLFGSFIASAEAGKALEDPNYYATAAGFGPQRLAEAIEESTFWSAHLLRKSANVTWFRFGLAFILALILLLGSLPFTPAENILGGVRVGCALLVLFVSTDVIGAAFSYSEAATLLDRLLTRITAVRAANFPLSDVLLILCDYNSTVEGAPMFVPGLYDKHKDSFQQLWDDTRPS